MKTAFLFSGQGAQYVGMGKDLLMYDVAKNIFQQADAALGFSISDIILNGPDEKLMQTRYTQPAILTMSIAIYEILKSKGITADVVAGLSLGEYGALYAAGVFDFPTVIKLVHERGKIMETSATDVVTAMYAIIGGNRDMVANVCEQVSGIVEISNYNCTGQIVIAGEKVAVETAVAKLKEEKIRAIPLKVSGAFHTSLLADAGTKLGEVLTQVTMQVPNLPVLTNVTGDYYQPEVAMIKKTLAQQVYSAVHFEDELLKLAADGVTTFIEIGPKNTLTTFVKKTLSDVAAIPTDTLENIEKIG